MNDPNVTPQSPDGEAVFDLFNLPAESERTPDGIQSDSAPALTASERFERFHEANPHVYDALARLARRWRTATGREKQSVQRLIEIARWDEGIRTGEDPEINNDFAAYYARLLMFQEADLAGVFEIRRSPEADAWIAVRRHVDGRAA